MKLFALLFVVVLLGACCTTGDPKGATKPETDVATDAASGPVAELEPATEASEGATKPETDVATDATSGAVAEPEPATEASEGGSAKEAIAQLAKLRDEACECEDEGCVESVRERIDQIREPKDVTEEDVIEVVELVMAMEECTQWVSQEEEATED